MKAAIYLDKTLEKYSGLFDIARPFALEGKVYDAYAYFSSVSEKYVLTRKANLWSAHAYEHILFLTVDELTPLNIEEAAGLIRGSMQSVFVTKGEKYPEKDHMYSFLTVVFFCQKKIDPAAASAVRHFRYDKSFLFNIRGYCEGRMIAVDLEDEAVFTNKSAAELKATYESIFRG